MRDLYDDEDFGRYVVVLDYEACHRIELSYVRFPVIGPVMPPAGPRLAIFHSGRALPMLERSTTEH